MVFQRPVLLRRSALGNVTLCAEARRRSRAASARSARCEALRKVGLDALADRAARVLSGGEQQRLALARVWALRPEILFLDEPTASLDPGATHEIENIIRALHAAGTKIVMVTHNLGQAQPARRRDPVPARGPAGGARAGRNSFLKHPASPEAARFLEGELPW